MKETSVDNLIVGQVIAETVPAPNGGILCNANVIVSKMLIQSFKLFGVKTVKTKDIECNFVTINNTVEDAKHLVSSIMRHDEYGTFNILYNYDEITFCHSTNVASLMAIVLTRSRFSDDEIRSAILGGALHDIGKLKIPGQILDANRGLTEDEFEIIKAHPQLGFDMVKDMDIPLISKEIILQHHENADGTGYPYGLCSDKLNVFSELCHICDVYEAMCSKRPYKDAMDRILVKELIQAQAGRLFNKELVEDFFRYVPLYFIGETVIVDNTIKCVVTDNSDDDPIVTCNGLSFRLSKLKIDSITNKSLHI